MKTSPAVQPKKTIRITLEDGLLPTLEGLLLKMRASELSELRRAQTQLTAYGDRRATLEGLPAEAEARIAILDDLLRQVRSQR